MFVYSPILTKPNDFKFFTALHYVTVQVFIDVVAIRLYYRCHRSDWVRLENSSTALIITTSQTLIWTNFSYPNNAGYIDDSSKWIVLYKLLFHLFSFVIVRSSSKSSVSFVELNIIMYCLIIYYLDAAITTIFHFVDEIKQGFDLIHILDLGYLAGFESTLNRLKSRYRK